MRMTPNDPRRTTDSDTDLRLLLAEGDREDPILTTPPREDSEQELDEQILAGLVTP
jgi:hypothetical protein